MYDIYILYQKCQNLYYLDLYDLKNDNPNQCQLWKHYPTATIITTQFGSWPLGRWHFEPVTTQQFRWFHAFNLIQKEVQC